MTGSLAADKVTDSTKACRLGGEKAKEVARWRVGSNKLGRLNRKGVPLCERFPCWTLAYSRDDETPKMEQGWRTL